MNLRDLPAKGKERWQNFSQAQKIATVLISVSVVVVLFYISTFLLQPTYAPLFKNLEVQEAGKVVENLKALNIDYQVTDQGRTIMVPEKDVYDLRMQMASNDVLPGTGQGLELFGGSSMAKTDFENQVLYQRALQEELRRSITALSEVEQARVHLVLPQRSVFIDEEGAASASVVLQLAPMGKLQPSQVKGISNLLMGSVESISPENIHIIDTHGNVLNDYLNPGTDNTGLASTAIEQRQKLKKNIEKAYEQKLKQALTRIFGPGRVVAMVAADLDYTKMQTTRTDILEGQIVSEQKESSSGSSTGDGGPAGTTSQMPGSSYPSGGGGSGEYNDESSTVNYENGKEVTVIEQQPGAINRISTSVIVDSNVEGVDRQAVQQVVAGAIGYEPQRGDEIIVQTMPFNTSDQDAFAAQQDQLAEQEQQKQLYNMIGIGAGILILLLLILILFIRSRRKVKQQPAPAPPMPSTEPEQDTKEETSRQVAATRDRNDELKDMAQQNPEEVAQVLKLWLKE